MAEPRCQQEAMGIGKGTQSLAEPGAPFRLCTASTYLHPWLHPDRGTICTSSSHTWGLRCPGGN